MTGSCRSCAFFSIKVIHGHLDDIFCELSHWAPSSVIQAKGINDYSVSRDVFEDAVFLCAIAPTAWLNFQFLSL